jgi:hypothetical protein
MRARRLLEGSSFGPEAMKVMGQAFDAAWRIIGQNFGDDPMVIIEEARYRLANCVLSVAREDSRDVGILMRNALEAMAHKYRDRFDLGGPFSS